MTTGAGLGPTVDAALKSLADGGGAPSPCRYGDESTRSRRGSPDGDAVVIPDEAPPTRLVDALLAIGRRLSARVVLGHLVHDATDPQFGAFFCDLVDEAGGSSTLYTPSEVPREAFSRLPSPCTTAVFAPAFDGLGTVRREGLTADPRFSRNEPYHGLPEGHRPGGTA